MEEVLHRLPNSLPLLRRVARMRRAIHHTRFEALRQGELHGFIDRLQLSLARTNNELSRVYFVGERAPSLGSAPARVA
jgi:hypothetical protein